MVDNLEQVNIGIQFDNIAINSAASGAGVFNGANNQFGWSSHAKTNSGLGTIGGHHNPLPYNINILWDNDKIDTTINDQDIMWSVK
ncbi:hypothetical protein [Scopulibacillus cellulosilyticus]|uniref:Spore germination protein GerPA/GerPF n=1 Tax=Scopulibacillus cellulosilyticus TaxID=2665665 RepID=A0ABW2Q1W9_9BACL